MQNLVRSFGTVRLPVTFLGLCLIMVATLRTSPSSTRTRQQKRPAWDGNGHPVIALHGISPVYGGASSVAAASEPLFLPAEPGRPFVHPQRVYKTRTGYRRFMALSHSDRRARDSGAAGDIAAVITDKQGVSPRYAPML